MLHATARLVAALLSGGLFASTVSSAPNAGLSATAAWLRWLPDDLPAAGYVVIKNDGSSSQRLTRASSPDYSSVMLHRSMTGGGNDRMVATSDVDIASHGSLALAPGGYHLMLMNPKHSIKPGDTVEVHLMFASGASLDVVARVKPATATGPG
jgi:copper(I)-binding protein